MPQKNNLNNILTYTEFFFTAFKTFIKIFYILFKKNVFFNQNLFHIFMHKK